MKDKRKIHKGRTQLQTIFHFLKTRVATASQVSQATGIYHKNICRFKRDLEKGGHLAEVRKGICPITKHRAWFITTNPDFFPKNNQLKLL